jgi:hypothetical protein
MGCCKLHTRDEEGKWTRTANTGKHRENDLRYVPTRLDAGVADGGYKHDSESEYERSFYVEVRDNFKFCLKSRDSLKSLDLVAYHATTTAVTVDGSL